MNSKKINIVITGVCYFKGMASTNRVRNLLQPLIEKDAIIIKNIIANKGSFLEDISKSGVISNVKYIYCGKGLGNPFVYFYQMIRGFNFLVKAKEKDISNILYCYQSPDITNIFYLIFSKLIGFKLIIDITEDASLSNQNLKLKDKIKKQSVVLFEKLIPYIANSCIGITKHIVNKLEVICKDKVPVYHIPISVDFERLNIKQKSELIKENETIFYGGSYTVRDGIYSLIDVFDKLASINQNLFLKITGDTNVSYLKSTILDRISKCQNKSRIIMTGYLSYEDYIKNLIASDICCIPRTQSPYSNAGFPSKLGEFLASGSPVIVSQIGEVSLYLQNNFDSLIITPGSDEELYQAIYYLLSNKEKSKILSENGRNTALKYFDSRNHAKNLLEILINC